MRNQVFKKLFSVLLALIMVAGLLPASVLAEGEGNADSTPAPTEAVQPTESAEPTAPTETETPEVTEVPEPTPENPATTVESDTDPTPAEEVILAPVNEVAVQAETKINYVTKTNSVPLPDGTFYRIVHLDCGRKYFKVDEIKKIIDFAAANSYTHVELAFGNDGLRFLLGDMSVTVGGTTYENDKVKAAIQQGNIAYSHAGELTEEEMGNIIAYAQGKGIGIIPMFDAPGHLQAVVKAMETLEVQVEYTTPTQSGSSWNYAVNTTDVVSVNFIQALMQKYITYFAGKGCTMFNIAADECGFTQMSGDTYTAYAKLVNSMAAMVQNAGMTALAFNDGIYHKNLTTNVEFDTDIAICYWDASESTYASAATLAGKGFKIINTHNKWYYVPGNDDSKWFGYEWSKGYMNGEAKDCTKTDGGYSGDNVSGCMNAIWLDNPNVSLTDGIWKKIEDHIALLAKNNPTHFKAEEVKVPAVEITEGKTVKEVRKSEQGEGTYEVVLFKESTTAQTLKLTVANGAEGAQYSWTSNNDAVATVEDGIVTFMGAAGTVKITATPVTATRSISETAAYSITLNVEVEGDVKLEERPITVTVGGTKTDVIKEYNYSSGTYTTENTAIATVTVTGTDATEGEPKYNSTSVTYSALASNNTSWTRTKYYYTPDNGTNYYPVYAKMESYYVYYYYYYYYYGYSITDKASDVTPIGNGTSNGRNYVTVYTPSGTDPVPASTTVTFKGVAEGKTSATIGHVKYNITVTKEDLTSVAALPVQLWITNVGIQVDGLTSTTGANYGIRSSHYVSVAADTAYGPNGVPLSELVPSTITDHKEYDGTWWDKIYQGQYPNNFTEKTAYTLILAKGTKFTSGNYQQVWGDNQYASGADFKYVRYYNSAWWVSTDNTDETKWVKVTDASVNGTGTQVVAYYMQETKVTNEVTTYVVDWGNAVPDKTAGVIVDYSVKYSDGTQIPKKSEFPKQDKTMFFRMINDSDTVRRIYDIRALETTNREVYMITVTPNSDVSTDTITLEKNKLPQYSYNGTEKVAWVKDESDLPVEFQDESTHYTSINGLIKYTVGGEPTIKGVEIYENQAMLVTYYLRDKVTQDTLYVHYIDKTADKEFYQYTITVEKNTFFDKKINKKADPNWKDYLDYGTVKNDLGVDITVSADLGTMPKIGAEYRYADYYCESVKWEEPGKHVYLYYTFKYNVTFVVDFGLPLVITPDKVNASLGAANITSTIIKQASYYADIKVVDIKNVVYKLNSTIDGEDNFTVTYKGANLQVEGQPEGSVTYTIRIIPATNVYYEDSFAKFTDGSGTAAGATWTIVKNDGGTLDEQQQKNSYTTQALEALGNKTNVYGYDDAYKDSTMFSMGSARKVTVTSDMATNWNNDTSAWPTAQFTFKGTGFDIISLTDNTSGAIFVDVTRKGETTPKTYVVNNYYGYSYKAESGTWEPVQTGQNNALYQIPVIAVRDLEYDEYNVVITVAYNTFFDKTTYNKYSFWLDAVRVYDPMGKDNAIYNTGNEKEGYPQYIKLRDAVANADASLAGSMALFIDGAANATIVQYKNLGPNNEVYLANGQAITFKLTGEDLSKIATVQIGAKAPNGTAKLVVNNGEEKELGTATEMYYAITDAAKNGNAITITNNGNAILSLTNLKITFNAQGSVSLGAMNAEEQAASVMAVRALFAPAPVEPEPEPEPEKTFEPERFEASWSKNVMQGRKATLTVKTSEDVEAITVDGQTIRSYRTRTERVGFGRRAKRITYREFTYSMVAQESADFSVTAINAEGTESEAITARLTVKTRPNSMRDMWNWFKGWF